VHLDRCLDSYTVNNMYTSSSLSPSLPLSLECASFPNFIASFIADFIEEEEDAFHFIGCVEELASFNKSQSLASFNESQQREEKRLVSCQQNQTQTKYMASFKKSHDHFVVHECAEAI